MSNHHHTRHAGWIDPDDPLTMMGMAMAGMALQEMDEQVERDRRARLSVAQRAAENRQAQQTMHTVLGILGFGILTVALFCLLSAIASAVANYLH